MVLRLRGLSAGGAGSGSRDAAAFPPVMKCLQICSLPSQYAGRFTNKPVNTTNYGDLTQILAADDNLTDEARLMH